MKKNELIASISVQTGVSKSTAKQMIDVMFEGIKQNLSRGKDVRLNGLGRLHVAHRKARNGRNPSTGEAIKIPAKNVVKFSVYSDLDSAVNK